MIQSHYILDKQSHWIDYEIISPYHFRTKSKDDAILPRSRVLKSPDHLWTYVPGWYNPSHVLEYRSHQIHSELRFTDDTILPPYRWPKSLDPFWIEVHGWYNPTTFLSTEVTRSILNRGSQMIQSYHVLEYQSQWIHSEPRFKDDTILPSQWPKSPDPF